MSMWYGVTEYAEVRIVGNFDSFIDASMSVSDDYVLVLDACSLMSLYNNIKRTLPD